MNEELDVNSFQKAGEDERIDLNALVVHMKQKGRSEPAIKRTLWAHKAFYEFLTSTGKDRGYEIVSEADLEAFVYEAKSHQKNLLMGLGNVFDFLGRDDMRQKTSELREEMLSGERKSMPLKEFLGIEQKLIQNLAGLGIKNASQLLEVCVNQTDRQALAEHCGFSYKALLELIKMQT